MALAADAAYGVGEVEDDEVVASKEALSRNAVKVSGRA
jgi:hypothetical protein